MRLPRLKLAFIGAMAQPSEHTKISFSSPAENTLRIQLAGIWKLQDGLPSVTDIQRKLESESLVRQVTFEAKDIIQWDTSLVAFLLKVLGDCQRRSITVDQSGLPEGVQRLLKLASAVPERKGAKRAAKKESWISQFGKLTINSFSGAREMVTFLGEVFLTFLKFFRGKARFRWTDFTLIIQECGPQALPIVTLISFLVGLILAFVGAVQLLQFGAQIYVANLVGLGMVREMGAMMTAIIMAGRTGAAFAAQLGTMRVNQEIDALTTMGFSPMEFLVLPRMLALMLMMPLLCLYSDLWGLLGGWFVGVTMLDIGAMQYLKQTQEAITIMDFSVGLFKGVVFGVLVAIAGCLRGMQCGNSSSAVGLAATSAVVTGMVFIVVSDALLTVLYDVLGI
jgi:phospholipid/cholesterol/gamma-HCH transport system permease protein